MKNQSLRCFILLMFILAGCSPMAAVQPSPITVAELPASEPSYPVSQPTLESFDASHEPPRDNFFKDYGINGYVETDLDHLSTFAVDVDTASYTVVQRYINDGMLPPYNAVRVEEFLNYFDYDYPTPADVAFGVWIDGSPSPFHTDGTHFIRIGIQGYEVPEEERKPASLIFVIDVSGSMNIETALAWLSTHFNSL